MAPPPVRRGVAGWPIRRKLVALVAGPLALILAAGVYITAGAVGQLRSSQRSQAIAEATLEANSLATALQNELADTIIALGNGAPLEPNQPVTSANPARRQAVQRARVQTDRALNDLTSTLADRPAGGWGAEADTYVDVMRNLPTLLRDHREQSLPANPATPLKIGAQTIRQGYGVALTAPRGLLSALAAELSLASGDGRTVASAATLAALSGASAAASREIVELSVALGSGQVSLAQITALQELKIQQDEQLALATRFGTPAERAALASVQADTGRVQQFRNDALSLANLLDRLGSAGTPGSGTAGDRPRPSAALRAARAEAQDAVVPFASVAAGRLDKIDRVAVDVARNTRDAAADGARDALLRVVVIAGLVLLSLLLVSAFAAAIARTVSAPLRRLRAGAVEAATVRLPAAVRQIEREGPDAVVNLPPVLPPDTRGGPETLEVARAVDGLSGEAVRLASSQVRLRQALDEAFVSMSRRSQSMVEKQLSIIDELESSEEDPDQLRNLFRLDHLAARMRRYNDNLLVLAGSAVRTRSSAPVPIADVFRAATSEMEQYERVRLQPVSGASVSGPAAGGLIHLLAELLDNAAMYSPPTSPILMAAAFTPDGGLQLEITDSGVGIPPNELSELNARLALPGSIDTQVPSRMGLFVVARLAQRGGFTVRLAPRPHVAGTVAEVLVPAALVVGAPSGTSPMSAQGQQPDRADAPAQRAGGSSLATFGSSAAARGRTPVAPRGDAGDGVRNGRPVPVNGGASQRPTAADVLSALGRTADPSWTQRSPGPTGPATAPGSAAPGSTAPGSTAPGSAVPGSTGPGSTQQGPARTGSPAAGAAAAAAAAAGAAGAAGSTGRQGPPARTSGGLPSRRPGAALSGGPLASGPQAAGPIGAPQPARPVLPTPFESSGSTSVAGGATAWRPRSTSDDTAGRSAVTRGEPVVDPLTSPSFVVPDDAVPTGEHIPFGVAATSPSPFSTVADGDAPAAADRQERSDRAGGLPVRRPGAGSPGAATAAAAAAAARRARTGGGPTPAAGLFTARGPLSSSGSSSPAAPGVPSARVRPSDGDGGTGTPASPAAGVPAAGTDRQEPANPAGRSSGSDGTSNGTSNGTGALPVVGSAAPPAPGRPGTSEQPAAQDQASRSGGASTTGSVAATGAGGSAPAAWDSALPTELAARAAAAAAPPRYRPADPSAPLIGTDALPPDAPTPIFDTVSVWFTGEQPVITDGPDRVIDLRDDARRTPVASGAGRARWSSLGDQRWQATNARAMASPEVAGTTEVGLPRRRPGANLLPSAATAAPAGGTTPAPARPDGPRRRADADAVRGRLGSYQRGLSSARRARHLPNGGSADALFAPRSGDSDAGRQPGNQGGDQ